MKASERREAEEVCGGYIRWRFDSAPRNYRPDDYSIAMGTGSGESASAVDLLRFRCVDRCMGRLRGRMVQERMLRLLKHVHLYAKPFEEFELFILVAEQRAPDTTVPDAGDWAAAQLVKEGEAVPPVYPAVTRVVEQQRRAEALAEGLEALGPVRPLMAGIAWLLLAEFYKDVWASWDREFNRGKVSA